MKTRQSTGYLQQAVKILLLVAASTLGISTTVLALNGNDINACYDCHGSTNDIRPIDSSNRDAATGGFAGSHQKHIASPTTNTSVCVPCHGVAPTAFDHRNGQIDISSNINNSTPPGTYSKGVFFNQTSVPEPLGTCSNVNCHASPYGTSTITTPAWGTAAGCAACHTGPGVITASGPATGGHSTHSTSACTVCHNAGTSATTTPSTGHADGDIDILNGYPANTTKHVAGTYTGTCSTAVCHGSSSPVWGTGINNDTCTKCHGTGTASGGINAANRYLVAPPASISGAAGIVTGTGQVSNNTKVGAHQTHLQLFNGFTNYSTVDFRCEGCHGALPVAGNHANGSSAPAFQGLAVRGGKSPAWNAGTFTCSNTYCHNPAGATGGLNAANAGTRTFVSWTASSYLGDTRKTETNCNRCHKSPGTVAGSITITSGTSHASFTIASDCSGCHGHNGDAAGAAGQRHMDGIKYGGGSSCNGCHSYDTADWATATHNYGGTAASEGIGAHAKHIAYIKTRWGITLNPTADMTAGYNAGNAAAVCGVCHSLTLGDHMTGGRNINFNGSTARQFGSNSNTATWYSGVSTTSSAVNQKTCSNLDCHYGTTPLWSTY